MARTTTTRATITTRAAVGEAGNTNPAAGGVDSNVAGGATPGAVHGVAGNAGSVSMAVDQGQGNGGNAKEIMEMPPGRVQEMQLAEQEVVVEPRPAAVGVPQEDLARERPGEEAVEWEAAVQPQEALVEHQVQPPVVEGLDKEPSPEEVAAVVVVVAAVGAEAEVAPEDHHLEPVAAVVAVAADHRLELEQ